MLKSWYFEKILKHLQKIFQESFYNEEIIYSYQTPSRALLSNWDNTIMNWIFISSGKLGITFLGDVKDFSKPKN